jgi:hypothetical protein
MIFVSLREVGWSSVQYWTFLSRALEQYGGMEDTKPAAREKFQTRALLRAEMAQPRKALSVRLKEAHQKLARAKEKTLAGKQRKAASHGEGWGRTRVNGGKGPK